MPTKDNNLLEQLNQIKQDQQTVNDSLARIKETADAELLPVIEEIEKDGYGIIFDIDEIKKQINRPARLAPVAAAITSYAPSEKDLVERNSILRRMPTNKVNPNRVRIGGIWVG